MEFMPYTILSNEEVVPEVFYIKLKPQDGSSVFPFQPGQFCQIKNPTYTYPEMARSFSIASTANTKEFLEFVIKKYGPYTQALTSKKPQETLLVAGPLGKFVWEHRITSAVFLAGGVGIGPLISMMRYLKKEDKHPSLTLFYGNRSVASIACRKEIEAWFTNRPESKLVHVLSDLDKGEQWNGYRGYITKELIEKEADLSKKPVFFLCGPPIFVQLMKDALKTLLVDISQIRSEIYSSPPPPKAT